MLPKYVFRGDTWPFAPDPNELRAREAARREAEELAHRPLERSDDLSGDAEIEEKIGDYQVGGLDSFGAEASLRKH
jgi:hypothetical protein